MIAPTLLVGRGGGGGPGGRGGGGGAAETYWFCSI